MVVRSLSWEPQWTQPGAENQEGSWSYWSLASNGNLEPLVLITVKEAAAATGLTTQRGQASKRQVIVCHGPAQVVLTGRTFTLKPSTTGAEAPCLSPGRTPGTAGQFPGASISQGVKV